MPLTEMKIAQEEGKKGRAGRAYCLSAVTANALWEGGKTVAARFDLASRDDVLRPVHAVFLGSEDELRPFAANLQLGREILDGGRDGYRRHDKKTGFVFLKSAGYRLSWQREPEGSILTVFLPELFLRDPGMVDPAVCQFVLLPSREWAAAQTGIDHAAIIQYAHKLDIVRKLNKPPADDRGWRRTDVEFVPKMPDERLRSFIETAYLFVDYLDKRSRAPILCDGRFYLHVLLAALHEGYATFPIPTQRSYSDRREFGENTSFGFQAIGLDAAGFLPAVAFKASHDDVEKMLAGAVETFYEITKGE